jgi:7-cyano-7-deazaguanine synthase in queuosine biosynthesis
VEGYVDNEEEGVIGYGGRLNIRSKYQREFIYDEKKRESVIDTIQSGVKAGKPSRKTAKCFARNIIGKKVLCSRCPRCSVERFWVEWNIFENSCVIQLFVISLR